MSRSEGAAEATAIAPGVHALTLGRGALASNVYFVRSGESWVLVDAGWPGSGQAIARVAESLFGAGVRPAGILATHLHPDHTGSARELSQRWAVPVSVHPGELPTAAGGYLPEYANPLDRWVVGPVLRLLPARTRDRIVASSDLTDIVRGLDPRDLPGLPDWEAVPSPGHTPGHVAFHRPADGVLITGDAVLTVDLNSVTGVLRGTQKVSGPPAYTTWSRPRAHSSIAALAALEPRVLAPGHGEPLLTGASSALHALAERVAGPRPGRTRGGRGSSRGG
ncbi:MAG TPA: MBL fold metallo-hydrolase [Pseudonocardia sp.]|nr:MBL fold metallo-hydrolase [Pseudonocardia sp.]